MKQDSRLPGTTRYALFRSGRQISKPHSTRAAAMMEAFQRKAVVRWSKDFWSDKADVSLACGYEVKECANAGR